jgi:hypothetical protein
MTPDEATALEIVNRILSIYPTGITGGESADRLVLAIAAALRAQRPRWSTDKPTEPGWYAYRHPSWPHIEPVVVRITISLGAHELMILWGTHNQAVSAYRGTGEWAPVLLPEEGA